MAKSRITGFGDLQKQLEAMTKRMEKYALDDFCEKAAKELAARLLAKVISRTPVGHKPKLGAKSATTTSRRGKKKSFLTRSGAILETYWAGYVGGTLRRGWTSKTEREAEAKAVFGADLDNAEEYAKSLPVKRSGDMYEITIINPVNWASYVEYGHVQKPGRYVPQLGKRLKESWVPGKLMLTKSEIEMEKQAPGILDKMLKNHLEEVLRNS